MSLSFSGSGPRPKAVSAIEVFGGSIATAYGVSSPEHSWSALAARTLGAVEYPFASNGVVLGNEGNGTNKYIRPASARRPARNLLYGCRAPANVVVINAGLADLAAYGKSLGVYYPDPVKNALRGTIAFARLGAFYGAEPAGASHSSIAYGGTWNDLTSTDRNTGVGFRYSTAVGATLTITVPSQFPGGEIDLFWVVSSGSPAPTLTLAVTGATTQNRVDTLDAAYYDSVTALKCNYIAQRINNLNPGAHTITVTLGGTLGFGLGFDGWGIVDPDPPNVVLCTQITAPQAALDAFLGGFAGDTPTASGIVVLNDWIRALAPEFSRLSIFDTPEYVLDLANSTIDGIHPNDTAQALIATKLLNHIAQLAAPGMAPAAAPQPAPVDFAVNWSNAGGSYANATHTVMESRQVRLAGRVTRTGAPSPPETILTLPERHRPLKAAVFLCNGSSGTPTVTVNPNGTVQYTSGTLGAGGTLDLDPIQFQIDSAS